MNKINNIPNWCKVVWCLAWVAMVYVWFVAPIISTAYADTFEFLICPKDSVEDLRIKKGDIICIKEYPSNGMGTETRKRVICLLVQNLTSEELVYFKEAYFEDGVRPDIDDEEQPDKVAKRRHYIDIDELLDNVYPSADLSRYQDYNDDYQPLYDNKVFIDADALPLNFDMIFDKYSGFEHGGKAHE